LPFAFSRRCSISCAQDSTMKVDDEQQQAQLDQRGGCRARWWLSVNSLAMVAEIEVPGANKEGFDAVRIADDEGHRHGFRPARRPKASMAPPTTPVEQKGRQTLHITSPAGGAQGRRRASFK